VVLDRESALPWLLGIASHTARNAARASRRYRAALARLNPDDQFSADHADAVAAAVDSERLMAELRQAVGRLPRHEREVIELCAWSGLDVKGAAVALGVPAGTVKSRLHRARRRLAADLGEEPGGPPRPHPPAAPTPAEEARWTPPAR
jgi:RNA polymerase sigma-70 factor (ECF subfamily)